MPSPAVSHTIMTVTMLIMFVVAASSIQGILVTYKNRMANIEAESLAESLSSQLISAVLILQKSGSEGSIVVLEFYRRVESQTSFYNVELESVSGGVRVVVESLDGSIREYGNTIPACTLTNSTFTNSTLNHLSSIGVRVSGDGTSVYTGVPGPIVVWAVRVGGEVIVGLGWFER